MDTWICMDESLHYSLETITTLLISYTPIQNKKVLKTIELQAERKSLVVVKDTDTRTCLLVQWVRICPPMWGHRFDH